MVFRHLYYIFVFPKIKAFKNLCRNKQNPGIDAFFPYFACQLVNLHKSDIKPRRAHSFGEDKSVVGYTSFFGCEVARNDII